MVLGLGSCVTRVVITSRVLLALVIGGLGESGSGRTVNLVGIGCKGPKTEDGDAGSGLGRAVSRVGIGLATTDDAAGADGCGRVTTEVWTDGGSAGVELSRS